MNKRLVAIVSVLLILSAMACYFVINFVYFSLNIVHNVAIAEVTVSQNVFYPGNLTNISVVVRNQGNQPESFTVTTFCNETVIGTKTVDGLQANSSMILTFDWNTAICLHGTYLVKAVANTVPNEANTTDNTVTIGPIEAGNIGNPAPASDYFSFSEVGAEAEIVSDTVIRIRILHFNITAIGGNATGLNIFTAGMFDPTEFADLQLANGTSKICDIQLPSRPQVIKKESVFPVTIKLTCQEAEGDVTLGIPPENVFPS